MEKINNTSKIFLIFLSKGLKKKRYFIKKHVLLQKIKQVNFAEFILYL